MESRSLFVCGLKVDSWLVWWAVLPYDSSPCLVWSEHLFLLVLHIEDDPKRLVEIGNLTVTGMAKYTKAQDAQLFVQRLAVHFDLI